MQQESESMRLVRPPLLFATSFSSFRKQKGKNKTGGPFFDLLLVEWRGKLAEEHHLL